MEHHYRVIPYNFFGVTLYAVERDDGYINKYCDTRPDAQDEVDNLNGDSND